MQPANEKDQIVVHATYELLVFLLVLLSVGNIALLLLLNSPEAKSVVLIVDTCISLFLMADAIQRLVRAPNKRSFLFDFHGWMIFVGSLPAPGLRLLRLLQTILMTRKLRRSDYDLVGKVVIHRRSQTALAIVVFLAVLVMEVGGIMILRAESHSPTANIKTASDALWWGYVTVATVGYGDKYPVTNAGRLVGILMMTIGVGLFGVFTGFLADWFRRPRKAVPMAGLTGMRQRDVSTTIEDLRRLLEAQEQAYQNSAAEIRARLATLEAAWPIPLSPPADHDRTDPEEVP